MKLYYGWWIVMGSIVCQFTAISLSIAITGVFIGPVIEDLGWKVWEFTLGSSMAIGAGTISSILVGKIVDSKGPRILIITGALISGVSLSLLGIQTNLAIFLGLYIIAGLVGWNLFSELVVNATISKWFIRHRGWALAIGSVGVSLSGLITPFVMIMVVDSFGWRAAYVILAVFVVAVVTPIACVMRRTPEDYGLTPDGGLNLPRLNEEGLDADAEPLSFTRPEAIRTQGFWMLVVGFGLIMSSLTSVFVHAIPFCEAAGFSRRTAAMALSVNGFGNLASKPVWGYFLQSIQARGLVMIAYSLSAMGVVLILTSSFHVEIPLLFLGFLMYGFGFGGTIPLREFLWARYFGRAHIGSIRGVGHPLTTFGTMIGPVITGYWFDASQSYNPAFLAIIATYIIGAYVVWLSKEPIY